MGKRRAEKTPDSLDDCLVEIRYLANAYERRVRAAFERETDPAVAVAKLGELRRDLSRRFGGARC